MKEKKQLPKKHEQPKRTLETKGSRGETSRWEKSHQKAAHVRKDDKLSIER